MKRRLWVAVLGVVLTACGDSGNRAGFINRTGHTDAQLWAIWSAAQASLAKSIDLNPLQQATSGAAPDVAPGDPRALSTVPQHLTVSSQPDVSSAALLAATGTDRPNPTGMILCPQPCNVRYTPAYSRYSPATARYAASWEQTASFDPLLEYEFENQILFTLGYNMTWR